MEAVIRCYDGREYVLPTALEWEFSYGLGSPCDGFTITCLWEPGLEKSVANAVYFYAAQNGQRVFTGIVDEYRCIRDETGSRLELSGRGMQALLLDNEALAMEYQTATVRDILRNHVSPYGIETVGGESLRAVAGFTVSSGQSEWNVLHGFVCGHNDIVPRFDRLGRLVLSVWEDSTVLQIGNSTAISRLVYGEKRYGVLSQVVVRDRSRGTVRTLTDEEFAAQGGRCRRVMTVNGSGSTALRETGEYQLRRSRTERVCCEVTVAGLFCAFPGQLVKIERTGFAGNGVYRVAEMTSGVNKNGSVTELTLREKDLTL